MNALSFSSFIPTHLFFLLIIISISLILVIVGVGELLPRRDPRLLPLLPQESSLQLLSLLPRLQLFRRLQSQPYPPRNVLSYPHDASCPPTLDAFPLLNIPPVSTSAFIFGQ